ncbi:MAG TPA: hypothetical protein EYP19_14220 [Desulfobacterales bacterium]|nr:hypothetical protein [Desulfobacterales bacterium]
MVENQINDSVFLRRVMPPVWRKRLEAWERDGELRFVNGGGLPVMKALVEYHSDDDNARLAFGLPADVWCLVHFVVYDHDGSVDTVPGEQSHLLGDACRLAGMGERSHRLRRKDQEHYIPIDALKDIVNARVTNPADRECLLAGIDRHYRLGIDRHFSLLPALGDSLFFKNEFTGPFASSWSDTWFERDDAWTEMTQLAEQIASTI